MPVAGEDAVLDRSAVEREAHVRTAVVNREQATVRIEQDDRVTADNGRTAVALGQIGRRDRSQPLVLASSFFARFASPRKAGKSGSFVGPLHHGTPLFLRIVSKIFAFKT
jgi:hypothetical protein